MSAAWKRMKTNHEEMKSGTQLVSHLRFFVVDFPEGQK